MAAPLVKTSTPGIFSRGSRYVFSYRVEGRQKWESCRTLDEARKVKRAREAAADRGELSSQIAVTFHEYATEWIERYQGKGRNGFRENTRDDYRRDLNTYAFKFFGPKVRMAEITPRRMADFVAWLCEQPSPKKGKKLADASVRRIVAPVRACMGSAAREGVVRHNPTLGVSLPYRERMDDEETARALTREQLGEFLSRVPAQHRLLMELLVATGLRISEALALRWQDLELDAARPFVRVRRGLVRGQMQPPKSKASRRDVPLPTRLARELRNLRGLSTDVDACLVFCRTLSGDELTAQRVRDQALEKAAAGAGVPWMGLHTLRHTCASILFDRGLNAVQVQRWLGHHSAAFTLSTYVHLLSDEMADALDLDVEVAQGVNKVQTHPTDISGYDAPAKSQETPQTKAQT